MRHTYVLQSYLSDSYAVCIIKPLITEELGCCNACFGISPTSNSKWPNYSDKNTYNIADSSWTR